MADATNNRIRSNFHCLSDVFGHSLARSCDSIKADDLAAISVGRYNVPWEFSFVFVSGKYFPLIETNCNAAPVIVADVNELRNMRDTETLCIMTACRDRSVKPPR